MSDNSAHQGRPMTRREIREREEAAARARAAGAETVDRPTRRSLHAPAVPSPAAPPVVRPPSATGGVRGLDETGRLTPIQRTGADPAAAVSGQRAPEPRPQAPAYAAPAVPTRTSSRTHGGPRATPPSPTAFPRPATEVPSPFGSSRAAQQASPAVSPALPWGAAPTGAAPTGAAPTGAAAPGIAAPGRQTAVPSAAGSPALPWGTVAGGARDQGAGTGLPATSGLGGVAGAPRALPPTTPQPSPFDSFVAPEPPVRSRAEAVDEHEDRGPSYTWLHYIILVVVAFGLGWLLWQVIANDGPSFGTDDASGPAVTVTTTIGAVPTISTVPRGTL